MNKSTSDTELLSPRLLRLIKERDMILGTDGYGNLRLGFPREVQIKMLAKFLGLTEEESSAIPDDLHLQDGTWELIILKLLMEREMT